jgi:hypothetical protein
MAETVDAKVREDRVLLDLIGDKWMMLVFGSLSAIIKVADASMKSAATFPGSHRRVWPLACEGRSQPLGTTAFTEEAGMLKRAFCSSLNVA